MMHLLPQSFLAFIRKAANKTCRVQWKAANVPRRGAHLPDPVGHGVRARGAVVGVDDDDGDDDGSNDEHHGEQHVLANQRHCTGRGGDQLHDDQQEHSQRQQHRDAESHFLTCHRKKPTQIIAAPIIQYREHLFEKQGVGESCSHKQLCAFAVPASKAVTRLGKPGGLTASAPAPRWELPGMTGLRCGWWIFLLVRSISWAVHFEQCSICT